MTGRLLSLLGWRSASENDEARAVADVWAGIYDIEHSRGVWLAFRLDGPPRPVLTGRTPGQLAAAICADWKAEGAR